MSLRWPSWRKGCACGKHITPRSCLHNSALHRLLLGQGPQFLVGSLILIREPLRTQQLNSVRVSLWVRAGAQEQDRSQALGCGVGGSTHHLLLRSKLLGLACSQGRWGVCTWRLRCIIIFNFYYFKIHIQHILSILFTSLSSSLPIQLHFLSLETTTNKTKTDNQNREKYFPQIGL